MRFENSSGNWLSDGLNSVRFDLSHNVRYGMYVQLQFHSSYCTQNGQNSMEFGGWSGGAMVLGKLTEPGRPTILITVGQGPIGLAVGAGGGGLDIFTLIYPFSSFSHSLGDSWI